MRLRCFQFVVFQAMHVNVKLVWLEQFDAYYTGIAGSKTLAAT